ncbi:MAG: DUF58 domain-containing protein [Actinomycetota bacterium]
MLTPRGFSVLGAGGLLWLAARIMGSTDLHAVAFGLILLPLLALLVARRWWYDLEATRRLDERRVFPGTRVTVEVEVRNRLGSRTAALLLEDRLPPALGRRVRGVIRGLPPRGRDTLPYTLTCGRRGKYEIGPLRVTVSDPFFLARQRIDVADRSDELLVYPAVEELGAAPKDVGAGGSGESAVGRLLHARGDFYTMREYQIGDDLRRVHWASTARTGHLMIRQDESERGANATVVLDTRSHTFGGPGETFERAVSAAASLGFLYARGGFGLRLAMPDVPPQVVTRELLLETLATIGPSRTRNLAETLRVLRPKGAAASTLVVVTGVPSPQDVEALLGAGAGFAARIGVFVLGEDASRRSTLQKEADERVTLARAQLSRAGWRVLPLPPGQPLRELWTLRTPSHIAASS